ncbi:hypothetical protein Tco_1359950 [Tanacetum coccineum]
MSDNIPFEIQMEIIEKFSDVKSLFQFMSVSKPRKSFIDSSECIIGYGARHTQLHSFILSYNKVRYADELKYIHLVAEDDNNETFKVQQELAPAVVSLLIKQFSITQFVGASHGLVCRGNSDVRVMEHDLSFKKLFLICARVDKILGFRESGEPIIETPTVFYGFTTVDVYDMCSHQINNLGIDGASGSFDMGSYKESLLLPDHSDLHIYCDANQ